MLLAVTVLTSLDAAALAATGVAGGPREQVLRLGRLAIAAGADGLVCSPHEVAPLRDALGRAPVLVVPGIRPAGSAAGDQARTMTPREAMARRGGLARGRPPDHRARRPGRRGAGDRRRDRRRDRMSVAVKICGMNDARAASTPRWRPAPTGSASCSSRPRRARSPPPGRPSSPRRFRPG